ncbi:MULTISPECIES: glycosyltransferase [Chryseobacterium]|uniref:glycosyltransferase n=1 Tax=Chryseobacterium TaxID=59732 RepID=UPI0006799A3F|nr:MULTISPECIES: glycosyltransferase [Chryseobacterium]
MNPLVSILIPSYNHSRFITETLNSVKKDTYTNKEIVIIDDGSKDDSVQVIREWIKNNPDNKITFINRENRGLCATLNELLENAKGDYVVLVASDDLLINNTIAERVDILRNSDKMVLLSDAEVIDSHGNISHQSALSDFHKADKDKYRDEQNLLDEIIFNFSISGAVLMVDVNIFKLIGKYPEDLRAEDLYFYISAAAKNKILFYDKIVSKYRIHESNTSGVNPELLLAVLKTYKRLFFKIPGFTRKLKLLKRMAGLFIKTPNIAKKL